MEVYENKIKQQKKKYRLKFLNSSDLHYFQQIFCVASQSWYTLLVFNRKFSKSFGRYQLR